MRLHKCGACGAQLFTARYRDNGMLVHVEKADNRAGGPALQIVPELPGVADGHLPHVEKTIQRQTPYREHYCTKVTAYAAHSFQRKSR